MDKNLNPGQDIARQFERSKIRNPQLMRTVQVVSWLVTLGFLAALVWSLYQAIVMGESVPIWVWLGMGAVLAAVIGLIVAAAIYRSVAKAAGPFDFHSTGRTTGELKQENQRIELAGAGSLHTEIKMLEGVLMLQGGEPAMDASYTYDTADWKPPDVQYTVESSGMGRLTIEQQSTNRPAMRQGRCEWRIELNHSIPTELDVVFGAGEAELDLKDLNLTRLRVKGGVGKMSLDLSGSLKQSLEALIQTGIGDTLIRIPKTTGVRVQSSVGLGSIHTNGLQRDGNLYINPLYGQTDENLDLILEGGIGKITLD